MNIEIYTQYIQEHSTYQKKNIQEHSKNKANMNKKQDERNDFIYMEMMFTR